MTSERSQIFIDRIFKDKRTLKSVRLFSTSDSKRSHVICSVQYGSPKNPYIIIFLSFLFSGDRDFTQSRSVMDERICFYSDQGLARAEIALCPSVIELPDPFIRREIFA